MALAGRATAQTAPPIAPLGGGETLPPSARSYHEMFERRRLDKAMALVRAGDCTAATAYALRQKSADTVTVVTRLCTARTVPTPAPGDAPHDADGEVAAFGADPAHPLFPLVRAEMARLLREGRTATLQEAYDAAVRARAAELQASLPPAPR